MKKLNFLCAALAVTTLFSCEKETPFVPTPAHNPSRVGFYVISEGTFGRGDSKLSYYDYKTDKVTVDYYESANNGEALGDNAMDIVPYGSKVYIILNGENKVRVIDNYTGKKITDIDMGSNDKGVVSNPRYAVGAEGKIFVSTWKRGICVIDTTSLAIKKEIKLTEIYSEGIVYRDGKLYVANSGIEGDPFGGKGTTVSVVSTNEEKELETISVGINPNRLKFDDNGNLYVATWGDWSTVDAQLYKVDVKAKKSKAITGAIASKVAILGNYAYTFHFSYITATITALKINLTTEECISFIVKPKDYGLRSVYDVNVDPITGHIFLLDESGLIVMFSSDFDEKAGKGHYVAFKDKFGIRTNSIAFRYL